MGTHPIFESDFDCLTDLKMWNGRNKDVERLLKLRSQQCQFPDEVCTKVLTQILKFLKKTGQNKTDQFFKTITNPNECVCLLVPKSELKKMIKVDQINHRAHELAVPIFLARIFQNSPHYSSQRN